LVENLGSLSENNNIDGQSKLVIIEIGCGVSLHSLRLEVDLLCQRGDVDLIRINPNESWISDNRHVGIGLGALSCLVEIEKRMSSLEKHKIVSESDRKNS